MIDRKKLDEIILANETNNWWKPDLFEKNTRSLLPSELEILSPPPPENINHNCFIYALRFSSNEDFIKECSGFIYDSFFKKLLEENEILSTEDPVDGDIIIYKDMENYPKSITHVGIVDKALVISKWAWGPLIRHKALDVPASYGNTISYVKGITENRAQELYKTYGNYNVKQAV